MATLTALNGGGEGSALLGIGIVIIVVCLISQAKAEWIVAGVIGLAIYAAGLEVVFGFFAKNKPAMVVGGGLILAWFYSKQKEKRIV